jgi:hypothetical protein
VHRANTNHQLAQRDAQSSLIERSAWPDPVEEIHTIDQLHREEPPVTVRNQLVQFDEIRVQDRRERPELLLETEQSVGVDPWQFLDGDAYVQLSVVDFVYHTHASGAQLAMTGEPACADVRRRHPQRHYALASGAGFSASRTRANPPGPSAHTCRQNMMTSSAAKRMNVRDAPKANTYVR